MRRVVLFFIFFFLSGCLAEQKIQLIEGAGFLSQPPSQVIHKVGLLSDIHGHVDQLDGFLEKFKEKKVEVIVVLGDSILNEQLSYGRPDKVEDERELEIVLDRLEGAGVPVLVIPGNHEGQKIYSMAFSVKRPQIYDLVHYRFVDLNGLDIISLPGYYIKEDKTHIFLPKDGFFLSEEVIENVSIMLKARKDEDPVLVVTHAPPLSSLESGFDVVLGVGHTGSAILRKALVENAISFAVFGHIHEAGPEAENETNPISEGAFSSQLWVNVGAVQDGHAGVLELAGKEARFVSITQ